MSVSNLHRWAIGRPIYLAMGCQQAVMQAGLVVKLAGLLKDKRAEALLRSRVPPADAWAGMYHDRAAFMRGLVDTFYGDLPEEAERYAVDALILKGAVKGDIVGALLTQLKLDELPHQTKLKLRAQVEAALREQYRRHLKAMQEELAAEEEGQPDDETWAQLDAFMSRPEVLFFFLVLVPCALEYQEWPWDLYRRALDRDFQALEKLLRIDKRLIRDEGIGDLAVELGLDKSPAAEVAVSAGYLGQPEYDLDLRKVHYMTAGWVARLGERFGRPFKPREIVALFDAAHRDRSGSDSEAEPCFADSPENQRQVIHRYKDHWDKMLPRETERDTEGWEARHAELGLMAVVSDDDEPSEWPDWVKQAGKPRPPEPLRFGDVWRALRRWLGL